MLHEGIKLRVPRIEEKDFLRAPPQRTHKNYSAASLK
jgi:hypothetical protein